MQIAKRIVSYSWQSWIILFTFCVAEFWRDNIGSSGGKKNIKPKYVKLPRNMQRSIHVQVKIIVIVQENMKMMLKKNMIINERVCKEERKEKDTGAVLLILRESRLPRHKMDHCSKVGFLKNSEILEYMYQNKRLNKEKVWNMILQKKINLVHRMVYEPDQKHYERVP